MSYQDEQLISFEHVLEKSECENFEKKNFDRILSGWINNRVNFFDVITMPLGVLNLSFHSGMSILKNP